MNVVSHVLNPPINARYIRVIPESYYLYEALRLEFYGCKTSKILVDCLLLRDYETSIFDRALNVPMFIYTAPIIVPNGHLHSPQTSIAN